MKNRRLIIVGANAAGLSAALRARRRDPALELLVFEAGQDISWGACGMPYNLADPQRDSEDLHVRAATHFEQQGVRIATGHRVTALEPAGKTLSVRREATGDTERFAWDRLVIASGASTRELRLPGHEAVPHLAFKQLQDLRDLKERLPALMSVAIVGAGPVGLELCEALHARGISIELLDREEYPLAGWPLELRKAVAGELERNKVKLCLGPQATLVTRPDLILNCTGQVPNTGWAVRAGLAVDRAGRLLVDHGMRTSHHDIFAAGDCVIREALVPPLAEEVTHLYNPQALEANRGGRVAGWNAAGVAGSSDQRILPPSPHTLILRCFGLELARTGRISTSGNTESMQKDRGSGIAPNGSRGLLGQGCAGSTAVERGTIGPGHQVSITSSTHGHGLKEAGEFKLWLESDARGRLRGAAILCHGPGALRINIIAALLQRGGTVGELAELDLAYSPPFGPAWDPLLIGAAALGRKLGR